MVYTARFKDGRSASTISQELANKAYLMLQDDPTRVFTAGVKPGRYPNTFQLVSIE